MLRRKEAITLERKICFKDNGQYRSVSREKDIRSITSNKRMFITLLIVPLVLTIFVPSVFILVFHFMPENNTELLELLELECPLPAAVPPP